METILRLSAYERAGLIAAAARNLGLGETTAKWERIKGNGVLSVEMESSGLEAIADHLGVEFYTFFFAGDILGESWISGDLEGERGRRRQVSAAEVALALGRSIAK